MSYWKVKSAEILDDGRLLELQFIDCTSKETMGIRLPAEEWKNFIFYRSAYEDGDRMIREAIEQAAHLNTQYILSKVDILKATK